jgi:hypothetical protein
MAAWDYLNALCVKNQVDRADVVILLTNATDNVLLTEQTQVIQQASQVVKNKAQAQILVGMFTGTSLTHILESTGTPVSAVRLVIISPHLENKEREIDAVTSQWPGPMSAFGGIPDEETYLVVNTQPRSPYHQKNKLPSS